MTCKRTFKTLAASTSALCLAATLVQADIVHLDDVIIDGSLCVGFDCVNGESFGFDTIRLKENNLRIKAQDTSSSASFPSNDWQLTFNDSSNGGANKFSIDDIDGGRTPFTIEAGAPSHSLYVDDGGRIGLGTSTPVVEAHIVDGDTPTLRLEQDGSSGFNAQTWDVAGNETNFFVRDATNGSLLPFKIRPSAPTNSLYVNTNGDIGLGTASPDAAMEIARTTGNAAALLELSNNGGSFITLENTTTGNSWFFTHENAAGGRFIIVRQDGTDNGMFLSADGTFQVGGNGSAGNGMVLASNGNLTIGGSLTQNSDKDSKMAITAVDQRDILGKVMTLPITSWTYKTEAETGVRHIGPMAQDFYAAFGTGADETGISTIDTSGVALAAIQALAEQNAALQERIDALEGKL
ncbi:tail fiber domain-containing protein [Ruegeria aquimaris]|uniref:Tail fiber domain-containing protein n=1 Tax=Ruegeria aquimaris TaxID=2984333 RepID=A0ABT3AR69_9RHOB|nr:tail fiber domain-containing protein [Ruegeria sp. XHP0148]MCV2891188.1 tail fiber domain-containing protein [Ruegeria sp. XHP0148]